MYKLLDIYIVHAGPGHAGEDEVIDRNCYYGNEVQMTYNQSKELKSLVDVVPKAKIKPYVCTLLKLTISR